MSKRARRSSPTRPSRTRNYVGLNVGGKIYHTTRTTLTRYPKTFFDCILLGGVGPTFAKDGQGNYLIDRDGDIFRHVINFLRYGKLFLPTRFVAFHKLEKEAAYFMLDALKKAVKDELTLKGSVGLNVGGKIYRTSESVIRRHGASFFSQIIKRTVPKDDEGNYLIDQDGEIFQHVLDFMTSGKLVLPESFDELPLLQQEADFFALEPLKQAVGSLKTVGFEINNQVFKLSANEVLRHFKESMLATYPIDTQGNYVIEGIIEAVDHVMSYIIYGGIVEDITTDQIRLLRKDNKKLQLHDLDNHCKSLEIMLNLHYKQISLRSCCLHVHVYVLPNDPCIAYINRSPSSSLWTRRVEGIPSHDYRPFFRDMKEIKLGDGKVSISKVALKDGRPTEEDVISFFGSSDLYGQRRLESGGVLLKFAK